MAHSAPQQHQNVSAAVSLRWLCHGIPMASVQGPCFLVRKQHSAAAGPPLCLCHLLRAPSDPVKRTGAVKGPGFVSLGEWPFRPRVCRRAASVKGAIAIPQRAGAECGTISRDQDYVTAIPVSPSGMSQSATFRLGGSAPVVVHPVATSTPPSSAAAAPAAAANQRAVLECSGPAIVTQAWQQKQQQPATAPSCRAAGIYCRALTATNGFGAAPGVAATDLEAETDAGTGAESGFSLEGQSKAGAAGKPPEAVAAPSAVNRSAHSGDTAPESHVPDNCSASPSARPPQRPPSSPHTQQQDPHFHYNLQRHGQRQQPSSPPGTQQQWVLDGSPPPPPSARPRFDLLVTGASGMATTFSLRPTEMTAAQASDGVAGAAGGRPGAASSPSRLRVAAAAPGCSGPSAFAGREHLGALTGVLGIEHRTGRMCTSSSSSMAVAVAPPPLPSPSVRQHRGGDSPGPSSVGTGQTAGGGGGAGGLVAAAPRRRRLHSHAERPLKGFGVLAGAAALDGWAPRQLPPPPHAARALLPTTTTTAAAAAAAPAAAGQRDVVIRRPQGPQLRAAEGSGRAVAAAVAATAVQVAAEAAAATQAAASASAVPLSASSPPPGQGQCQGQGDVRCSQQQQHLRHQRIPEGRLLHDQQRSVNGPALQPTAQLQGAEATAELPGGDLHCIGLDSVTARPSASALQPPESGLMTTPRRPSATQWGRRSGQHSTASLHTNRHHPQTQQTAPGGTSQSSFRKLGRPAAALRKWQNAKQQRRRQGQLGMVGRRVRGRGPEDSSDAVAMSLPPPSRPQQQQVACSDANVLLECPRERFRDRDAAGGGNTAGQEGDPGEPSTSYDNSFVPLGLPPKGWRRRRLVKLFPVPRPHRRKRRALARAAAAAAASSLTHAAAAAVAPVGDGGASGEASTGLGAQRSCERFSFPFTVSRTSDIPIGLGLQPSPQLSAQATLPLLFPTQLHNHHHHHQMRPPQQQRAWASDALQQSDPLIATGPGETPRTRIPISAPAQPEWLCVPAVVDRETWAAPEAPGICPTAMPGLMSESRLSAGLEPRVVRQRRSAMATSALERPSPSPPTSLPLLQSAGSPAEARSSASSSASYALLATPPFVLFADAGVLEHRVVVYRYRPTGRWVWRPMMRVTPAACMGKDLVAVAIPASPSPAAPAVPPATPAAAPEAAAPAPPLRAGSGGSQDFSQAPAAATAHSLEFFLAPQPPRGVPLADAGGDAGVSVGGGSGDDGFTPWPCSPPSVDAIHRPTIRRPGTGIDPARACADCQTRGGATDADADAATDTVLLAAAVPSLVLSQPGHYLVTTLAPPSLSRVSSSSARSSGSRVNSANDTSRSSSRSSNIGSPRLGNASVGALAAAAAAGTTTGAAAAHPATAQRSGAAESFGSTVEESTRAAAAAVATARGVTASTAADAAAETARPLPPPPSMVMAMSHLALTSLTPLCPPPAPLPPPAATASDGSRPQAPGQRKPQSQSRPQPPPKQQQQQEPQLPDPAAALCGAYNGGSAGTCGFPSSRHPHFQSAATAAVAAGGVHLAAQAILRLDVAMVVDASSLIGWRTGECEQSARELRRLWECSQRVRPGLLVLASSRTMRSLEQEWRDKQAFLPQPDVLLLALGTQVAYRIPAADAAVAAAVTGATWPPLQPPSGASPFVEDTSRNGDFPAASWQVDEQWSELLDRSYNVAAVRRAIDGVVRQYDGVRVAPPLLAPGHANARSLQAANHHHHYSRLPIGAPAAAAASTTAATGAPAPPHQRSLAASAGRLAVSYGLRKLQSRHLICLEVHSSLVNHVMYDIRDRLRNTPIAAAAAGANPGRMDAVGWQHADAPTRPLAAAAAASWVRFEVQPRGPRGEWSSLYVLPAAAGKAAALRHVMGRFGVDAAATVAVGDTDRDAELLAAAGAAVVTAVRPPPALRQLLAAARSASTAAAAGKPTAVTTAAAGPGADVRCCPLHLAGGFELGDGGCGNSSSSGGSGGVFVVHPGRRGPDGIVEGLRLLGLL